MGNFLCFVINVFNYGLGSDCEKNIKARISLPVNFCCKVYKPSPFKLLEDYQHDTNVISTEDRET